MYTEGRVAHRSDPEDAPTADAVAGDAMTSPSRVLVVEDDERFAQAAALLLRRAHREVVVASDARSAREAASSGRFDAFVVDLGLPDEDGVELVRWLAGRAPHAPILVSTVARARATILDAVRAGASGYLFKEDMARRLAPAVEELLLGGAPMSAGAAQVVLDRLRSVREDAERSSAATLTPRERDVLRELARGLTYEQVAVVLGVSANTVRAHVRSIYEKLDAATRTEAVLTAIRMGLIDV